MPDRLSSDSLDDIKQRVAKATPAPWRVVLDEYNYYVVNAQGELVGGEADAVFIANARVDVLALIEEVEKARATTTVLREWAENALEWAEQVNVGEEALSAQGDLRRAFFLSFGASRVLAILDDLRSQPPQPRQRP